MGDIKNEKLIFFKGFLFLACCMLSAILIFAEMPEMKTAMLLCVVIWCSARFYYFMFYVIERYVDKKYKFSGICSFIKYLLRNTF